MIGPFLFAGSRWVAPRQLKDLRWPHDTAVADPWDAGSYVSIYWVEKGHHDDHFADWARPQVSWLYSNGRGFPERRHIHTILFDLLGTEYRDADPVPIELALDACYDGIVAIWLDGKDGRDARALHGELQAGPLAGLLEGTSIESASTWTPSAGEDGPRHGPMDLGTPSGGPERAIQLFFLRGDVRDALGTLHAYTDAVKAAGLADVRLVAPFFKTILGTDTYTDELW